MVKPVTLGANAMINSSRPNQIVLDLFTGSGSSNGDLFARDTYRLRAHSDSRNDQASFLYSKLGEHRLMCGDSTKLEDVETLMNGKIASLLYTPFLGKFI